MRLLRFLIYPIFGLSLLGGYGFYVFTGRDLGATSVDTRAMPPGTRRPGGGFAVAPIFWYGGYAGGK
ncbi:MAG: hypothetical protein VYE22_28120 [Myxococcota bacterium]|nr:hypothetical protein [Myxococcota bacterium]